MEDPPRVDQRNTIIRKSCRATTASASSSAPVTAPVPNRVSLSNLSQRAKTNNERSAEVGMDCTAPNALIEMGNPVPEHMDTSRSKNMDDQLAHFLLKQRRCDYFNVENLFINYLINI